MVHFNYNPSGLKWSNGGGGFMVPNLTFTQKLPKPVDGGNRGTR